MNKFHKLSCWLLTLPFIYSFYLERKTLAEFTQGTSDSTTTQRVDFNQERREEKIEAREATVTCTFVNDGKNQKRCLDGEDEIEDEKLIFSDEVNTKNQQ
jgi:hypothetical protein